MRIVQDLKAEYEARIKQQQDMIDKLKDWGNGLQSKLSSLSQQLYYLKNIYPDLSNIVKGQERWAPDALKNAIMLVDFLWAQYKSVWLMYKRAHEKKRRPFWHWLALIVLGAALFGTAANPGGAAAFFTANAFYLVAILALVLLFVFLTRRRTERKSSQPT